MRWTLALALMTAPAMAETFGFDCRFDTQCSGGPDEVCADYDWRVGFRFDTAVGTAQMVDAGTVYGGRHAASDEMTHFILANMAGAELVSVTDAGEAVYSGHMTIDGSLSTYRLFGRCERRAK